MKKVILLVAVTSQIFIACGRSAKEEKMERLHDYIDQRTETRNQYIDDYNCKGDNDEINYNVSNVTGRPVTNGEMRAGNVQQANRDIERAQNELDRLRDQ